VLGIDKASFPRYKACGGGLSPKVLKSLPFLPDGIIENVIDTVKLSCGCGDEFVIKAEEPFCHTVMREDFDLFLLERAKASGAHIKEGERVKEFHERGDLLEVLTDSHCYKGRFLIGADGAHSIIAKQARLASRRRFYYTVTAELQVPSSALEAHKTTGWIDIGTIPRGCAWIFPKKEHITLGVGAFYSAGSSGRELRSSIYEYMNRHVLLRDSCLKGDLHGHCISTLVDERSRIGKKNIFLTGEAGGLVDPFTGEGIYHAVRSAEILARLLAENGGETQEAYHRKIKEEFIAEFKIADSIARFVYYFPCYSHALLRRYAHLAGYYRSVLAGETGYRDIYRRMTHRIKTLFREKGFITRIRSPLS
jgi:geranylgeranyl reductase family protein